jgi:hypothetical protein
MLVAHALAKEALPSYSSRFSRHDFTLPQLFACLIVKEQLKLSYRAAEALLRDASHWCRDIGMSRTPDHNTLCRAARVLLSKCNVNKLLDALARWRPLSRILGSSTAPLAIDSTYYESHHVSRHYERRCQQTRLRLKRRSRRKSRAIPTRSQTVRSLPKLAIAVATHAHLVLSAWCGTGAGADHPHFEPLLLDAWRRDVRRRLRVVADAGYDAEWIHDLARREMGIRSIIPPNSGRPRRDGRPPQTRWRKRMTRLLGSKASRRRCGYTARWQVETVNSMMKRNLGCALAGKSAASRKRDLLLKVLTHNLMIRRS